MYDLDNYAAVRRFVFIEGHSQREAARVFGLARKTIAKMCRFSAPPGLPTHQADRAANAGAVHRRD